jgi:hypothetical protein
MSAAVSEQGKLRLDLVFASHNANGTPLNTNRLALRTTLKGACLDENSEFRLTGAATNISGRGDRRAAVVVSQLRVSATDRE